MELSTFDGFRYFVTFIDDLTHFMVVYLMKHKSEVLERIKQYEAMLTARFGQKLCKLRCDNGREYITNEFQRHCSEKGVEMVFTVPFNLQPNGFSERANRTLMEEARAMIHG